MKKVKVLFTLILEICFFLLPFWGIICLPSEAVPLTSKIEHINQENLQKNIENYLTSMPNNYYTIWTIETLKNTDNLLIIDVRKPSEYKIGHIPKAINIPLNDLTKNITQIPKNIPVILYCSTGYRSAMGVMALQLLGYSNVRGFPPSLKGWEEAGEILEVN